MQYLVSVIDDTTDEELLRTGTATAEEQAAIDVFNSGLQADGNWVFAGGLGSPHSATVVDNRGDETMLTDGPFVESKEFLAGFWILEAADLDAALALAVDASKACNRKIEVRPFL
ncbi:YciI family protein [Humibacter soli]